MTRNPAVDPSPPIWKRMLPHDDEYTEICEGDAEVLSKGQVASDGDEGPGHSQLQNTLSGVSHVFGTHEETDVESDHEEKTRPAWQKRC